jgi:O-antigen/teichoic acid export membrane protein
MSSLFKWQSISFVSRLFATVLGLAQSVVVARILTTAEYGLVGIVTAVAGMVGVVRHLGLVSATTRELARAGGRVETSKIFFSALSIRLLAAIPLSLGLFFGAEHLAFNVYQQPSIAFPLRLFAVIIFLQSVQEISNALIAGRREFRILFSFQAGIAVVSLVIFIPAVYFWGFVGFFWATFLVTLISMVILLTLSLRLIGWRIVIPRRSEFKEISFSLLGLGLVIYVGKVLYMFWQKVGTLYLGTRISAAEVGIFSFALLYAMKLLVVPDAVTDVNLPVMTNQIQHNVDEFKKRFLANFEKVYALMLFAGVSAVFWSNDLFHLLVGTKFDAATPLIPPLMLAVFVYGLLNLLGSSVFIPGKFLRELVLYHLLLVGFTLVGLWIGFALNLPPLRVVSWSMAGGGLSALLFLSLILRAQQIPLWNRRTFWPTALIVPLMLVYYLGLSFIWRTVLFLLLSGFYFVEVVRLLNFDWRRILSR